MGVLPPGPKSRIPGAILLSFRRDPLGFLARTARQYGDIAYFRLGPQDLFLLNHPDYVRDVLVTNPRKFFKGRGLERAKNLLGEGLLTSEGEFHLRQRRLAQPAFHRQRVSAYAAVMAEHAERLAARWQHGQELDLHREMMRLALGIAGKTLFDTEVEGEADEIGHALTDALEMFQMILVPYSEVLEKLPLPGVRRFKKARERLDATIYRIIRERRASGEDRGDLLSMLLRAQDTEGDGGGMNDEQLRDECMTIFLAGHETTANALTWSWYFLSQNPEAEARLHAEVDATLAERLPACDDLARLAYCEMVLAEAMRLRPPAWVLGRRVVEPYSLAGYSFPIGSLLLLSQWVMHQDERFFPDPLRFDPERWTPEARAARPRFCYFPFGAGPRQCIGEAFAWMEGVLVIAALARRWKMRLAPGQRVEMQPLITLRPRYGMRMIPAER